MNKIRRTLFIGLGGTGCQSVLYCKRRFLEAYGEVPKAVRFLVMDTTEPGELTAADGSKVKLDPSEFLKLQVREPLSLVKYTEEVSDWFPESVPIRTITNGAGQVRALGRLSLFGNAQRVLEAIGAKLDEVRGYTVERQSAQYQPEGNDITVSIVASLAGGTGSGAFLDVASLAISRGHLSETDEVHGYLLLPDIFLNRAATERVESNTYAALKELNSFMCREEPLVFQFGGATHKIDRPLFDAVFLCNNKNVDSLTFEHVEEITEFIGTAMWVSCTATGKKGRDIYDNVRQQVAAPGTWRGQPPLYASFGVSEMIFPREWFKDLAVKKGGVSLINKLVDEDVDKATCAEAAARFVETLGLSNDAILGAVEDLTNPRLSYPAHPNEEQARNVFSRKDAHVQNIEHAGREEAENLLAELKSSILARFDETRSSLLNIDRGALNRVKTFIREMEQLAAEYRESMTLERTNYQNERDRIRQRYAQMQATLDKASKRLMGKGKLLEKCVKEFTDVVRADGLTALKYHRADKSVLAYDFLLDLLGDERNRVEALMQRLLAVRDEFEKDVQRKTSEKRAVKPFIIELRPELFLNEEVDMDLTDFMIHMNTVNMKLTGDVDAEVKNHLLALQFSDLCNFITAFVRKSPKVGKYDAISIEDVLRQIPEEDLKTNVKQMYQAAAPLWQYNRGMVSGERMTHSYSIFAVPDDSRTLIKDDVVKAALGSVKEYPVESVNDPTRIICFKVELKLPAFVVYDANRYRDRYLAKEMGGEITSHIAKNWSSLPDLFPLEENDDKMRIWALALALPNGWGGGDEGSENLVFKRGQHYYARSIKKGGRVAGSIRLAQGRVEAHLAFSKDNQLVKEIDAEIDRFIDKAGRAQVTAILVDYVAKLRQEVIKSTDAGLRMLVDKEIDALEKWMNSERSLL